MTFPANSQERDAAIRELAGRFSETASGQPLDISVAAAALFIVAQADHANNVQFNEYVSTKLRQVAALYDTPKPEDEGRPLDADDELWGADPKCDRRIKSASGGGVKCTKCSGWFCY